MKRDEVIRAGDEPRFQDFDSVPLAALAGAGITSTHEPFEDTDRVAGDGDPVASGADAELPDGCREPTPKEDRR